MHHAVMFIGAKTTDRCYRNAELNFNQSVKKFA